MHNFAIITISSHLIMSDQIGRMLSREPSIVSYKSIDDLMTLKDWFYNFDDSRDYRPRAVQRVKALLSRGRLPHAIESTSLITSLVLTDPHFSTKNLQKDSNILQLSYSMVLVRLVNGLLDPLQQSNFAIPLHQLAKSLQLPSFFVELRHMATHEKLPSLDMLRITATDALNWLYDNYWSKIEDIELDVDEVDEELITTQDELFIEDSINTYQKIIPDISEQLKVYKKIRKQDLDYIYKPGNSTENGKKYWKSVLKLVNYLKKYSSLLVQVLLFDFLLDSKLDGAKSKKIESYIKLLHKLYAPLFKECNIKTKVYDLMIQYLKQEFVPIQVQINRRLGFEIKHEFQKLQMSKWIPAMVDEVNDKVLDQLEFIEPEYRLHVLEGLKSLDGGNERIEEMIQSVSRLLKKRKFEQVESLDSILGTTDATTDTKITSANTDNKTTEKKTTSTSTSTNSNTHYFFDPHPNWKPTPFGSIV